MNIGRRWESFQIILQQVEESVSRPHKNHDEQNSNYNAQANCCSDECINCQHGNCEQQRPYVFWLYDQVVIPPECCNVLGYLPHCRDIAVAAKYFKQRALHEIENNIPSVKIVLPLVENITINSAHFNLHFFRVAPCVFHNRPVEIVEFPPWVVNQ